MQGAVLAAKHKYVHAAPLAIRYEFASPEVVAGTDVRLRKDVLRMLTDEEIKQELEELFLHLPPPVQVVFANQRCVACGQTGDPRLMEARCHRRKVRGHTGHLRQRFSKPLVATTVGAGAAGSLALGAAAGVTTAGSVVLVGLPLVLLPGLALGCHRLLNTPSHSPGPCGPALRITDMRSDGSQMRQHL